MSEGSLIVVRLGCVGCGASLRISSEMGRLACAHCGTQQVVHRSGGAIHLEGVAETLSKVQVGTDKTAAELAIVRLSKERQAFIDSRFLKEQSWNQSRSQKIFAWSQIIEARQKWVNLMAGLAGLIGFIPGFGLAQAARQFTLFASGSSDLAGLLAFLAFAVVVVTCFVVVKALMQKSPNYDPNEMRSARDRDLADMDAQIAADLAKFDAEINFLNSKIQKQHQIANA